MKLKKLLALALVYLLSMGASFATKLPEPIEKYIKKEIPNTRVRFDGLITTPNGTNYIPVFPAETSRTPTSVVKETYPAGKKFSQYPDVILFENNFALLKLIKNIIPRTFFIRFLCYPHKKIPRPDYYPNLRKYGPPSYIKKTYQNTINIYFYNSGKNIHTGCQ